MYASEQDTPRIAGLCYEFRHWLLSVAPRNLVFVDESGVNLGIASLFARAIQGQRAVGHKPRNTGENISLLGALSLDGLIATMSVKGSVNTDVFLTYLTQVLLPQLWQGAIVVVDNLKVHHATAVRQIIEAVGARLVFLPPYSPDLSPIELCWSKVKQLLRSQSARTYEALHQAITHSICDVTEDDAFGWFAHCGLIN